VPDIRYRGAPGPAFPYPFAGYPLIDGVPGNVATPPRSARSGLAAALGRTLTALHALDAESLHPGIPDHGNVFYLDPLPASIVTALRRDLGDRDLEAWLAGDVEPPPPSPLESVVSHSDLADYHVILTPDQRSVSGIIDWFDLGLDDRSGDFVGFQLWLGGEFTERVLSHYGHPVDDGLRERIRFRARVAALWEHGANLLPGSPGDPDRSRRYVVNAFSSTAG
jgi:aminoglycoside phosphotransferase (APT) family kinase protein